MNESAKAELLAEIRYMAGSNPFLAGYLAKQAVEDGIPQNEVDDALADGFGYERGATSDQPPKG